MNTFFTASASNGDHLEDPSAADLAELLLRLGGEPGVRLDIEPVDANGRWDVRMIWREDERCYFLIWKDSQLGNHSSFESDDPAAVAERISSLVELSRAARR